MTAQPRWPMRRVIATRPVRAFGAAAIVVVLFAGGLVLTADGHPAGNAQTRALRSGPSAAVAMPVTGAGPARRPVGRGAVAGRARRFLTGYLPCLYGHGPAQRIDRATVGLRRRLMATRLRVSPATRQRRPIVVDLRVRTLAGGKWQVVATIADGGVARYPIELLLERSADGPVVSRVVSE